MKTPFRHQEAASVTVSALSFLVYLTTLCPTVSFTDAGELATVATTLGIAHPTGYPLFTLLGRLAVMIPSAGEEIVRLNLLAAVLTAASAGVFLQLILVIQDANEVFSSRKNGRVSTGQRLYVAVAASLVFAFSSTVWSQSTSVEVYSLHVLLILLSLVSFIKGLQQQAVHPKETSRYLLLFAFVLGLSFTNHMTTILLAPAFLYLYFAVLALTKESFARFLKLVPFFLLGLSLYLYAPIRSSARPSLDWGHPATLERLFWHISGKQYQVWMFEGWDIAKKQLEYFVKHFSSEFHWVAVAVLILGVFNASRNSRRKILFLALLFFTCLLYSINYQIHDINPYFLLSYIVVAFLIVCGLEFLVERANTRLKLSAVYVFLICLPVLQIMNNKKNVDESENFLAEDVTLNVLSGLKPNSVVFTSLWDYFVSPSYYYQHVRKMRPDVVIIDKALLQNRSWYFLQLERNHGWLIERSREKVHAFLSELTKFERGEPFNISTIQARWSELLNDLVAKSMIDHEVYLDGRVEAEFSQDFRRVPFGLLVKLTKPEEVVGLEDSHERLRKISHDTPVSADFRLYFCFMMTKNASWLKGQNMNDQAKMLLEEALSVDPTYSPAVFLKQELSK
ncbi:MAG TPA: DUF2723 domain-containing protein [Bacteroidota bacterium]|nr:DUF2723 domain-containing protein [Bacteroidota bacterium]